MNTNERVIFSAVNVVRNAFAHSTFSVDDHKNFDDFIKWYLSASPAINDYVIGIQLYQSEENKLTVIMLYDRSANIGVSESMIWENFCAESRNSVSHFLVTSNYMINNDSENLGELILTLHK